MNEFRIGQVPLPLHLDVSPCFDNYFSGETNRDVVTALRQTDISEGHQWVYLWGPAGSGISHLLAACHRANSGPDSFLIDAAGLATGVCALPDINREAPTRLFIDNADKLGGSREYEQLLVYALQQMRARDSSQVVFGAHRPPRQLSNMLEDLQSRIMWSTVYQIKDLTDEEKSALLRFRARTLGLEMSREVSDFLLLRCSRRIPELLDIVTRLDRLAMAAQRRLTIPWIKTVLNI